MANVFHAFGDFFKSIFELFYSFFQTAFDLVAVIIRTVFNFIGSILNVFVEFFKGIIDVVGGLGKFVLGQLHSYRASAARTDSLIANAAVIMLVAAGAYGYLYYQRRQGNTVKVQGKKLN
jgi:uncharacterized membrane protein